MQNWSLPPFTACAASMFRSNVPTLALLPAAGMALMVSSAWAAPRVMTQSMSLSWLSLAWMAEVTAESSAPLTWMFWVFGNVSFTPLQRSSRATDPDCWIVHRTFVPPAALTRSPACWPARNSSEEK